MQIIKYPIAPVPKPRMTRRDKWAKRPCVLRYWAFKDEVRQFGVDYTSDDALLFLMPMPKSWSKKRKAAMDGEPHMQTPDCDNLIKAWNDSLYDDDSAIHTICARKIWAYEGAIWVLKDRVRLVY